VRIEFHLPNEPDDVVGSARWDGRAAVIESGDEAVRADLARVFRPSPVVTDDAALRSQGTRGEVLLYPGTLEWSRAAAFSRSGEVGLVARVVPEVTEGGWDPAAQYRTFEESIERLESGSA
jgi:hypothetical protein